LTESEHLLVATQSVTILTPERLNSIGQAFFAAQQSGGVWECDASIDDLAATILHRREQVRAVVGAAPEASFEPQPDNERSEPVWSAGQLADHVVNAQYGVCETALIALITPDGGATFEQPLPVDEVSAPPILSRAAALERLDKATPDYERLLDGIPRDADLTPTLDHRYFGTINLKATLLICAWHEQGHAAQIERLAE
jgi:hypothetical protein